MKKRMIKKSVTVMMVVVMLFSLAGCSADSKEKKSGSRKPEEPRDAKEMVFEGEDFPLTGYQGDIDSIYVKNDRIYFDTYDWMEEGAEDVSDEDTKDEEGHGEVNGKQVIRLYAASMEGGSVTEIPLPSLEKDQELDSLAVGSDGMAALLLRTGGEKQKKAPMSW